MLLPRPAKPSKWSSKPTRTTKHFWSILPSFFHLIKVDTISSQELRVKGRPDFSLPPPGCLRKLWVRWGHKRWSTFLQRIVWELLSADSIAIWQASVDSSLGIDSNHNSEGGKNCLLFCLNGIERLVLKILQTWLVQGSVIRRTLSELLNGNLVSLYPANVNDRAYFKVFFRTGQSWKKKLAALNRGPSGTERSGTYMGVEAVLTVQQAYLVTVTAIRALILVLRYFARSNLPTPTRRAQQGLWVRVSTSGTMPPKMDKAGAVRRTRMNDNNLLKA